MKTVRKIEDQNISKFFTLNTWDDGTIGKACHALKLGKYVHMGSTATRHTMAEMIEYDAIRAIEKVFGEDVETVFREGWGDVYEHLVIHPCPCCGRMPNIVCVCGEYFIDGPCMNMKKVSFFHETWNATRKDWNRYVEELQHE